MDSPQSLSARLRHEARTPLNSILGMVELLEETSLDNDQTAYVQTLRRAAEKLISVVDGLPELRDTTEPAAPAPVLPSGLRILLVDDAEDNRFLIVRYLRNSGVLVEEAVDGEEAVNKVRTAPYDVVLMDVEMPVKDGLQAAREIRAWEREKNLSPVRIIALTAHDPGEALSDSLNAGCDELITKPVRKATLLHALARDSGVADLLPGYVAKRRADLPVLRDALRAGDFESIRALAHKLAGSGGGYGLPEVSRIGAALERAAQGGESTTAGVLIDSLSETLRAAARETALE